jgi:RimJ/RimL family protein N-acetyltransferase
MHHVARGQDGRGVAGEAPLATSGMAANQRSRQPDVQTPDNVHGALTTRTSASGGHGIVRTTFGFRSSAAIRARCHGSHFSESNSTKRPRAILALPDRPRSIWLKDRPSRSPPPTSGLFPLEDSGLIEIGYRCLRAAWGQGLATEAGRAVLDDGFRDLGIEPIVAVTHTDDLASQRVLEKIGLKARGRAFHYGRSLAFYHLSRNGYLRRRRRNPLGFLGRDADGT